MQMGELDERDIVIRTSQKISQVEKEFAQIHGECDAQVSADNYEVIEQVLTKPLYSQLMMGCRIKEDRKIEFYCRVYEFLLPSHLQIPSAVVDHPNFQKAKIQLQKMDDSQTPKLKLHSIYSAARLTSSAVASCSSTPTGIDDLLPAMMYLIIQSLPARPLTNINYIQELRSEKYIGKEEYYLTVYSSAMELIENLSWKELTGISEKEFTDQVKSNSKKYAQFLEAVDKEEEELKRIEGIKQAQSMYDEFAAWTNNLSALYPPEKLKFADCDYQSLSLGDLQQLFNEYHVLHKHIQDSRISLGKLINKQSQQQKSK